jgi:hypothetical protein
LSQTWRVLSKSFSDIYLGESISFYVCVTNDSIQEDVVDLNVRVDLQLANNRVDALNTYQTEKLEAKNSVHNVIDHEVTDLDKHLYVLKVIVFLMRKLTGNSHLTTLFTLSQINSDRQLQTAVRTNSSVSQNISVLCQSAA